MGIARRNSLNQTGNNDKNLQVTFLYERNLTVLKYLQDSMLLTRLPGTVPKPMSKLYLF
jgi:hypothetical protein